VKPSPTKLTAVKGSKKRPRAAIAKCRAVPPTIYVYERDPQHSWRDPFIKAHLRNKLGYVYLCWRSGKRVRTFYLGKAPRSSPTTAARGLAGAGELQTSGRRGK